MRVATALLRALVVCALVACAISAWSVGTAAAQLAAPPAGYKIDLEFTQVSTDGAMTIEQYLNKDTDDDWKMAVLGAPAGHIHVARSGAGRLSSGVSLHQ